MASGTPPSAKHEFPCAKARSAKVARGMVPGTTGVVYACQRSRRIQTIPPMHRTITASMPMVCMLSPSYVVCLHPMLEGPCEDGAMCRLTRSPWMYGRFPQCTDTGKRVKTPNGQEATSRYLYGASETE